MGNHPCATANTHMYVNIKPYVCQTVREREREKGGWGGGGERETQKNVQTANAKGNIINRSAPRTTNPGHFVAIAPAAASHRAMNSAMNTGISQQPKFNSLGRGL